jgi:hypothetical protein
MREGNDEGREPVSSARARARGRDPGPLGPGRTFGVDRAHAGSPRERGERRQVNACFHQPGLFSLAEAHKLAHQSSSRPPTGEPDAGDPHVRFGGRGGAILRPYPLSRGGGAQAGMPVPHEGDGGGLPCGTMPSSLRFEREEQRLPLSSRCLRSTVVGSITPALEGSSAENRLPRLAESIL